MVNYTIIIPHHNIPNLLRRCLHSIPSRDDIQIIVVDDCSDEIYKSDLLSIEKEFLNADFYYSGICKGGGAARNIGLQHAKGKYVLFADADDFFNYCIGDVLNEYINETCDIIFFNANCLDTDTYLPKNRIQHLNTMHEEYERLPEKAITSLKYLYGEPSCKFVKRELIEKNNIQFDETRIHNDTKFSYLVGFYANDVKVDHRAIYCLTERNNSVSKNTTHQAQLTRTKIFAEKNIFLKDHQIHSFDEIMIWPFDYYLTIHDYNHFKECLKIINQYGFSSMFVIKQTVFFKWKNCLLHKLIKKITKVSLVMAHLHNLGIVV